MYVYVNLDFKRVNVEYARGTLNYSRDDTSSRTRGIRMVMYVYVNLDFKRVNVEYARGTLNHYHYDTSSRTRGIQTVSRSCAYACGFSNDQLTKTLLAHITFVRFLVRVNTHVVCKSPDQKLLAHSILRFSFV